MACLTTYTAFQTDCCKLGNFLLWPVKPHTQNSRLTAVNEVSVSCGPSNHIHRLPDWLLLMRWVSRVACLTTCTDFQTDCCKQDGCPFTYTSTLYMLNWCLECHKMLTLGYHFDLGYPSSWRHQAISKHCFDCEARYHFLKVYLWLLMTFNMFVLAEILDEKLGYSNNKLKIQNSVSYRIYCGFCLYIWNNCY